MMKMKRKMMMTQIEVMESKMSRLGRSRRNIGSIRMFGLLSQERTQIEETALMSLKI